MDYVLGPLFQRRLHVPEFNDFQLLFINNHYIDLERERERDFWATTTPVTNDHRLCFCVCVCGGQIMDWSRLGSVDSFRGDAEALVGGSY